MHRPSLGDNSCPPRTVRGLLPEALRTMTLSYVSDLGPGVGALPPRARLASDAPRLDLDGTWRFRLVPTLDDVTEGLEPRGFDTSGWDEIPVPSSWQMIDIAGAAPYGKPAYLNFRYPSRSTCRTRRRRTPPASTCGRSRCRTSASGARRAAEPAGTQVDRRSLKKVRDAFASHRLQLRPSSLTRTVRGWCGRRGQSRVTPARA